MPVPRIVLVDDGDLIGAPCYVMDRVAGHVVCDQMPLGAENWVTSCDLQAFVDVARFTRSPGA